MLTPDTASTETNLPTSGERAPPDPAGAAPTAADDTAALVAAVRDYVRPSLRDSGFPLAEAFARETRQRESAAADGVRALEAKLAKTQHDLDVAARGEKMAADGWNDLILCVRQIIRPVLFEQMRGCKLTAIFEEEMRRRAEESADTAASVKRILHSRTVDAIGEDFVQLVDDNVRVELLPGASGCNSDYVAALAAEIEALHKEHADLAAAVGAHIRPSLKSRHPGTTLVGLLSLEMQERDAANADLRRETQDALSHLAASLKQSTENLEKTTRLLDEGTAEAERLDIGRQRALADLSEARADADALRSERDLLRDNHAAATARVAALEASLADFERRNRDLERALAAERHVLAEMRETARRLERAIVHQALALCEADGSARAFARGVAMRHAGGLAARD